MEFAAIGMGAPIEFVGRIIICDNCNAECNAGDVYYIPVLNRVFCQDCFDEWHKTATYYPEDAPYERRYFNSIKKVLEDSGLWEE